jgi:hypothetical protein
MVRDLSAIHIPAFRLVPKDETTIRAKNESKGMFINFYNSILLSQYNNLILHNYNTTK